MSLFVPSFTNRWSTRALSLLAVTAVLLPLATPLVPNLAGWSPTHGHVYASGVPIPHSHPWDSGAQTTATPAVFHLCVIHPDGVVPAADPTSVGGGDDAAAPEDAANRVVFLFDQQVQVGAAAIPPAVEPPACPGPWVAAAAAAIPSPSSQPTVTLLPPPRA